MKKMFIVASCGVGSWIGWWLGGQINIWGALVLSAIGTGLGLYLARKFLSGI